MGCRSHLVHGSASGCVMRVNSSAHPIPVWESGLGMHQTLGHLPRRSRDQSGPVPEPGNMPWNGVLTGRC
jgi:hypothetical protein